MIIKLHINFYVTINIELQSLWADHMNSVMCLLVVNGTINKVDIHFFCIHPFLYTMIGFVYLFKFIQN